MIFVTGDIHGEVEWNKLNAIKDGPMKGCGKNDYLIVCGDFGLVWYNNQKNRTYEKQLKWLEKCPFTVLFVDGNHENHELLNSFPVEEWNGGKIHRIGKAIHLMRGQVFTIEGKKFFTMGGAASHDIWDGILEPEEDQKIKEWWAEGKAFRINHLTWWKEEMPSAEEYAEAWKNLEANNFEVDYIITHCANNIELAMMGYSDPDELTTFLTKVCNKVQYQHHYFGHYHRESFLASHGLPATCIYNRCEMLSGKPAAKDYEEIWT